MVPKRMHNNITTIRHSAKTIHHHGLFVQRGGMVGGGGLHSDGKLFPKKGLFAFFSFNMGHNDFKI